MRGESRDEVVRNIYGAVLDGRLWDDALVSLARSTGAIQASLDISDPYVGIVKRNAPLCEPEYQQSHRDYWGKQFSLWRRTDSFPVGQVFTTADITDMAALRRSAFFNEWWLPQGTGGETLMTNIVADGRATAILAAYRPSSRPKFSKCELRRYISAIQHFVRAVAIHRRLRLAEARQERAGMAPSGVVVVDEKGFILASDEGAHRRMHALGILTRHVHRDRVDAPNSLLERLIAGAARADRPESIAAGHADYRDAGGAPARITVIPISRPPATERDWLEIDRPVALLHVSCPKDAERERIQRLKARYGLTPAEANVAVAAAHGDGRAAVAKRLGLRESTVRNHLSSIFDKIGIHRQAELVRLVQAESRIE